MDKTLFITNNEKLVFKHLAQKPVLLYLPKSMKF